MGSSALKVSALVGDLADSRGVRGGKNLLPGRYERLKAPRLDGSPSQPSTWKQKTDSQISGFIRKSIHKIKGIYQEQ